MNNTFIFLRHGKTKLDKALPIEEWDLTDEGKIAVENLAKTDKFDDVDVIISSDEKKAYLTVKPIADKLNKKIIKIKELGEIKRPNAESITKEQYEEMKVKIFKDFDFSDYEWETANHALNRFKEGIDNINKKYENKKILIGSHGTVMTLYFAYLQNKLDDIFARWKDLGFCDYGVIKDNRVVKDIV